MQNWQFKQAGFWPRISAFLIDLFLLFIFSLVLSLLFLEKTTKGWQFKIDYFYYLYVLLIIFGITFLFILMPWISKGKTIGQTILRIKVVYQKPLIKSILKHQTFWSLSWIFLALLTMSLINHLLIIKFNQSDKSNFSFSTLESFKIAIVSAFGSIIAFIQMLLWVSLLVSKNKIGFDDRYANVKVYWIKPYFVQQSLKLESEDNSILKPTYQEEFEINYQQMKD